MIQKAKFEIGEIVKHRYFDFRGVIFDVDPEFNNTIVLLTLIIIIRLK